MCSSENVAEGANASDSNVVACRGGTHASTSFELQCHQQTRGTSNIIINSATMHLQQALAPTPVMMAPHHLPTLQTPQMAVAITTTNTTNDNFLLNLPYPCDTNQAGEHQSITMALPPSKSRLSSCDATHARESSITSQPTFKRWPTSSSNKATKICVTVHQRHYLAYSWDNVQPSSCLKLSLGLVVYGDEANIDSNSSCALVKTTPEERMPMVLILQHAMGVLVASVAS
uniref:Uncharacterized protein n=1 Tax=Oryza glumipatula TaxID=40148 RepID=A0A0D9ZYK3_9ORYZ